jgi:hypothetical protein
MNRVRVSVEADRERGEDRRAVARGMAVERFIDMLEARLQRDAMARKQGQLGRATRQAFEGGKAMFGGELADGFHPGVKIERREARAGPADFGNALPDLGPYGRERIGCHSSPPDEGKVSQSC